MKKVILLLVSSVIVFAVSSCGGKTTSDSLTLDTKESTTEQINESTITDENTVTKTTEEKIKESKTTEEKIKEATTTEEVRKLLNGTTWHYTENLDNSEIGCWLKVEFKDGKYTSYYALPSEGKWTKDTSGSFELNEGRYANTGNRYISVYYKGNIKNPQLGLTIPSEIEFTTDDFQLNVHSPKIDAVLYNGRGMIKRIDLKGTMEYGDFSWD